jgi:hypothetical protein
MNSKLNKDLFVRTGLKLFRALSEISGLVIIAGLILCVSACGVRGRPQAPLTPPELGRGQPTFKRATQEFAFPNVPNPEATPDPRKKRDGATE